MKTATLTAETSRTSPPQACPDCDDFRTLICACCRGVGSTYERLAIKCPECNGRGLVDCHCAAHDH